MRWACILAAARQGWLCRGPCASRPSKESQDCADTFSLRPDFEDSASFHVHLKDTLEVWTPLLKQLAKKEFVLLDRTTA